MLQIITDSASDITREEAQEMNISVVPLRIQFEDGECPQETGEDFPKFYERLVQSEKLPTTSQPSPQEYLGYFETAQENGDEVLVITLSSGLSGTIGAAETAKQICGYDKIAIVDSRQAIMAQRMVVEYALSLRNQGMELNSIVKKLEELRDHITVCGVVDTLTYLRKGGRIPAGMDIIGNVIGIKPVIVLENCVLKPLAKVRGRKAGKKMLYRRLEQVELDERFPVYFGYSSNRKLGEEFMKETIEKYHLKNAALFPVGGVIGTHVGTDCIAISFVEKF